jgi:hypothetical protein
VTCSNAHRTDGGSVGHGTRPCDVSAGRPTCGHSSGPADGASTGAGIGETRRLTDLPRETGHSAHAPPTTPLRLAHQGACGSWSLLRAGDQCGNPLGYGGPQRSWQVVTRQPDALLVEQPPAVNTADPPRNESVTRPRCVPRRSVCGYGLTVRRAKLCLFRSGARPTRSRFGRAGAHAGGRPRMDCRVGRIVEHLAGGVADGLHRNLIWLQGDTGAYARHLLGVGELVRPRGIQTKGDALGQAPADGACPAMADDRAASWQQQGLRHVLFHHNSSRQWR